MPRAVRGFVVQQRYPALLSLLVAFLTLNWAWLSIDVTTIDWDRPRHLIERLVYNDILERVNLNSLLAALTHSGYYPPLFHLSMVACNRPFASPLAWQVRRYIERCGVRVYLRR